MYIFIFLRKRDFTMATRKTAAKPAAAKEVKAETKTTAAAKETAPVKETPVKEAPAKKAAPKKVAPKKPAAVAAAAKAAKTKTEAPAEVKSETKVNFVVEFNGKQNAVEEIIKNVKATYGKDAKEISIYLKPNEHKAYFVADGEEGVMDVYFC